jgi:ATP-dependent Zn protease
VRDHRVELDALVKALLEHETLERPDLEQVLGRTSIAA